MTPMVELAYNTIYKMIYESDIRELPSERILARQIGVNRSTLRIALNQLTIDGHLAPANRRRRQIPSKHNKPRSAQLIGIIHLEHTLGTIISQELKDKGYQPVEISLPFDMDYYDTIDNLPFPALPLDGIIAVAAWPEPALKWLEQFACPVVLLDHSSPSHRIVNLLPDERSTCRKFCRQLARRGATSAFFFDNIADDVNPMRWEAFVAAMTEFNLTIAGRICDKIDEENALAAITEVLHKTEKGTGLFCAYQRTGWRIARVMEKEGWQSPDDFYIICPGSGPELPGGIKMTCYDLDLDKSAIKAITVLDNILSGKTTSRKKQLLPTMIIPGGTL